MSRLDRRRWLGVAASAAVGRAAPQRSGGIDLLETAAGHVRIGEKSRERGDGLWGRIGGSAAERESARLLRSQLQPYVGRVELDAFSFTAHRPSAWRVTLGESSVLESAMPAPFDARFPDGPQTGALIEAHAEGNWHDLAGKWIYVASPSGNYTANSIVRERLLYQKAVQAGARGLIFSLPTPGNARWRSVAPVDKPYAVKDQRYPDGKRPIPCFSVDSRDGRRLASATGVRLEATIQYEAATALTAFNTVGFLKGQGRKRIAIANHLDSFFSGACDNATGIAATVGLAHRLARTPEANRLADFLFLGLAAHHDSAAGMRAFLEHDPKRAGGLDQILLIEHTDALDPPWAKQAGWPVPLNNNRVAYLGSQGWPEIRAALPRLVREAGVMSVDPAMQDACIADLFVVCGKLATFCLMSSPPYYHTEHDTLDKISREGIERAVEFHMRLIERAGGLAGLSR